MMYPLRMVHTASISHFPVLPPTWRDIFGREHHTPRSSIWREAIIEGMFIVITCTPEELEKYHLTFLKEEVKNTNEKFR